MKQFIVGLALAALLAGCTTAPFTQDMRDKYNLSPEQLQRIQFYNSAEIVLERHVERKTGTPMPDSRLQLAQTELIRKVVIPPETPGVAVGVTNDMLEISFENGKSLFFGSSPAKRKEVGGLYCLLARDWTDRRGTLSYGGETYRTAIANGAVHLLVDVNDVRRFRIVSKTLKGVTVSDHEAATYYNTLVGRRVDDTNSVPAQAAPAEPSAAKETP